MNTIIQNGIESAQMALTYWGIEKENILNYNKNTAINPEHELTVENCDHAIAAAQAELDNQIKIAKDLVEKNELIKSDYEDYLLFLKKTKDALVDLYALYPNPVLKVTIATLEKIIVVIETIINLFK